MGQLDRDAFGWGYCGDLGPTNWAKIAPDWRICATGHAQSPIQIPADLPPQPLDLQWRTTPGLPTIKEGAGAIQLHLDTTNTLTFRGKTFGLVQLHMHVPSEHQIGEFSAPGELHLVHQADDESLAVIGVFIVEGPDNPILSALIDHRRDTRPGVEPIPGPSMDLADSLPASVEGWAYDGSLTTPPCSEGVTWLLLKTPITCSPERLADFRAFFGPCARPLQARNGRPINGLIDVDDVAAE